MHINNFAKLGLCVFAVAVAQSAFAAEDRRPMKAFTEIGYSLPHEVEFVAGDEHYVLLEGDEDEIDSIITEVKGDRLKVSREDKWFGWSLDDRSVVITIGFVQIDTLNMAGSGDGHAEILDAETLTLRVTGSADLEVDEATADRLDISIAGSGNIQVHALEADRVSSKIAGSGDIQLAGRVVSQEISISGSGDHDSGDLRTQETTASVRGSGDIRVWAEARLSAAVTGSGDIEYYGEPEVSERIVGSGDLVSLGSTR